MKPKQHASIPNQHIIDNALSGIISPENPDKIDAFPTISKNSAPFPTKNSQKPTSTPLKMKPPPPVKVLVKKVDFPFSPENSRPPTPSPPERLPNNQPFPGEVLGTDYPFLIEKVLLNPMISIKHIPKSLVSESRSKMMILMDNILKDMSNQIHYYRFFSFCKFVFGTRGNGKNFKKSMKKRLEDWDELLPSQIDAQLFLDSMDRKKVDHVIDVDFQPDVWEPVSVANLKRCTHLASLGRFSDSIQSLGSSGIHNVNECTIKILEEKHPQIVTNLNMKNPDISSKIKLDENSILRGLKTFPRDSACGPDGLRVEFLKTWCKGVGGEPFMAVLIRFLEAFLEGKFLSEFACFFSSATLIPLRKPDGGVRPIAVGEVIRRLAGKCALAAISDNVENVFLPNQFGVCVSGGAESIIHSTNSHLERLKSNENYAVLQIDFKNAFNLVSRQCIFDTVVTTFPELAKFVEYTYGSFGTLVIGDSTLKSATGVQQGDPLAPLLFSLVLNSLILNIRENCPDLLMNSWYLDDGVLIGSREEILKAYNVIVGQGEKYGLEINPKKCVLFCENASEDYWNMFPPEIIRAKDGIRLLGAPIGCDSFIKSEFGKKVEEINQLMEKIKELHNPQLELILYRCGASFPKINFLLRTVDEKVVAEELELFESYVNSCISHVVGENLDSFTRDLWSLPMSMAGFGMTKASRQACAAFVSSVSSTWGLQKKQGVVKLRSSFQSAANILQSNLSEDLDMDMLNPQKIYQHNLKIKLDGELRNRLLKTCDENIMSTNKDLKVHFIRVKAILVNRNKKYANGWLHAIPAEWSGTKIKPYSFKCLLKYHSGMKITKQETKCPKCFKKMDMYGDHAISCSSTNQRITKHDTLVRSLGDTLSRAGVACNTELAAGISDRMGDLVLFNWYECKDVYLDFTVVNSLCESYRNLSAKGEAAEKRFNEKMNKYKDTIQKEKVTFKPMVVETLGGWHTEAVRYFKDFADKIANKNQTCPGNERKYLMTSMSIRLQKMNGEMLAHRLC